MVLLVVLLVIQDVQLTVEEVALEIVVIIVQDVQEVVVLLVVQIVVLIVMVPVLRNAMVQQQVISK